MKELNLEDPKNRELIEKLKYGTGLTVANVNVEAYIEEIFYNEKGNFFINANIPVRQREIIKPIPIKRNFIESTLAPLRVLLHKSPYKKMAEVQLNEFFYWESATTLVYFSEVENRVESAVTLVKTTFVPIKSSDLFGIIDTPFGPKSTYSNGSNINNNHPLEFRNINGLEVSILTFEDSGYCFSTLVDKKGNIIGPIYNSITNDYEETNVGSFTMSDFELRFFNMAHNEREFDKVEAEKVQAELLSKIYTLSPNDSSSD